MRGVEAGIEGSRLNRVRAVYTAAYPNTATLSFRAAHYQSTELTLRTTELTDNAGHPLQAQTPLDTRLIAAFDVPPYVNSADQSGAVPFLDIGVLTQPGEDPVRAPGPGRRARRCVRAGR